MCKDKKKEIESKIENTLAEIIGSLEMAESAVARVKRWLIQYGASDFGTSVSDPINLLAQANRKLGQLGALVQVLEYAE